MAEVPVVSGRWRIVHVACSPVCSPINTPEMVSRYVSRYVSRCFTICLCISPDLDGNRGTTKMCPEMCLAVCFTVCFFISPDLDGTFDGNQGCLNTLNTLM
jgi:hypothetical protein